ncbi:MAG TPA: class I SAM-dependent methyltransferase [Ktedonobacteraceae bacterium]|jgi:ubiquinone/menaquinone biosynthesis C-methylase UbiE
MSASHDRHVNDNPSTYTVQDRKNKKELTRLTVQDQMITASMGGVLSEQPDPAIFHQVLDIGCGPGGWAIEAAQAYPMMSLTGIDISERMIKYACDQAEAHQVNDRAKFLVMDALRPLEFPTASFDLVNLRFGVSYLRTWDWPKFLTELLRVTRVNGVIRITDAEINSDSNSLALTQLWKWCQCAFFRSSHIFAWEATGLTSRLAQLLDQYGCDQVQTKVYALEYRAGTAEGKAFYEDMMLGFQTARPFIQKWANIGEEYEVIYQQALKEMQQPDFQVTWRLLTFWGHKPGSRS